MPAAAQAQLTPLVPQVSAVGAMPVGETPKATSSGVLAVDYRNGEVTVVAEKAELGKVLELLGKKIGTSIEVAPEVAKDPVVAHLGPVTPTQALAQLLDGPTLEYIVMGSDESGHVLQRVVVRRRNSFAREPLVAVKAGAAGSAEGRRPSR
jgi:type II secretory pathway component GspD/PulD (secretin)